MNIGIDNEPEYEKFLHLYFELAVLGANKGDSCSSTFIDPRKSQALVKEFEHLLSPHEFKSVTKEFTKQIKDEISKALNHPDANDHTPLHIASYFGDFKAEKLMLDYGASTTGFMTRPLEIGKDKFARNVLQTLNMAAIDSNAKDVTYLVNCGEKIDQKRSIVGHAPIHNAVLATNIEKKAETLKEVIDC